MTGNTQRAGKDINWINAVKALCILLVFFRHIESYYGVTLGRWDGLYLPFYVNAFFFVSGYLFFWKQLSSPDFKKITGNVVYRIAIPSVVFAGLEFFPKKLLRGEGIHGTDFFFETFGGCTYWFTSALVVAELLFALLLLTRIKNIWFYFAVAVGCTCLGDLLMRHHVSIVSANPAFPWQYKQGLLCMTYMAVGGVYRMYESKLSRVISKILPFLAVVYLLLAVIFKQTLYQGYMISRGLTTPQGVLFGIFASVILVESCKKLPRIKFFTFIGRNSIGFYFLSGALPVVFSLLAHKLFPQGGLALLPVIWIICIAVAYAIVYGIVSWIPWLFDLRKLFNRNI